MDLAPGVSFRVSGDIPFIRDSFQQTPGVSWSEEVSEVAGQVGKITRISDDGLTVQVQFPGIPDAPMFWMPCFIGEVTTEAPPAPAASGRTVSTRAPYPGARVKVKSGVVPRFGWGAVKPESVGTYVARGTVNFPEQSGWSCEDDELEVLSEDGRIRIGSKVRVKKSVSSPRFGWGSITHADVGIVKTITGSGPRCTVDFEKQSNWAGVLQELEIAGDAPTPLPRSSPSRPKRDLPFKVGDCVRVKPSITIPKYLWGGVAPTDVGVVAGFRDHNTDCIVDFPDHPGWLGLVDELEKADMPATSETIPSFSVGDVVRVKPEIDAPSYGWGDVKPGSQGVVKSATARRAVIDFPEQKGWTGASRELEIVFKVGTKVRVKPSILTPKHGWGSVTKDSVGIVSSVSERGDCSVDFPEQAGWACAFYELEPVVPVVPVATKATSGSGTIAKGSFVRIKASITEPKSGWGGLSHGSVGVVKEIANDGFIVAFPEMDTWKGHAHELEALPTHPKVPLPAVARDEADSEGGGAGAGDVSASSLPRIMLHRALSSTTTNECIVCMENQIDTVLIHGESGHMCVCNACARLLKDCPICRKTVEKAVFVFKQ